MIPVGDACQRKECPIVDTRLRSAVMMRKAPPSVTSACDTPLRSQLLAALSAHADPERALQMQRYMKSEMPFLGVPMPRVQAICRELFQHATFENFHAWEREVRGLFGEAQFREERYAALLLARHRNARAYQVSRALPLRIEHSTRVASRQLCDVLGQNFFEGNTKGKRSFVDIPADVT